MHLNVGVRRMAEDANQHFVPQFYFRYFSKDGRSIHLILRRNGRFIPTASIKGQASRKYYYGNAEAERRLKIIDGIHSEALSEIRNSSNFFDCSEDARLCFYQFLMLQRSRTVAARTASQPMADRLMQLQLEVAINNDETVSEEKRRELVEALAHIRADAKQTQALHMSEAVDISAALIDLLPIYLENRTVRPFIFSDAPVVFINLHYRDVRLRGVLGADTPGLMILFPLSPSRAMLLLDQKTYGFKGKFFPSKVLRELSDVREINKLQIHSASSAIYFGSIEIAEYVRDLWRQECHRLSNHAGTVVDAPVVDKHGKPTGSGIVHSYQPQLGFMPDLSFLRYSTQGDDEYVFSRRSGMRA